MDYEVTDCLSYGLLNGIITKLPTAYKQSVTS